MKKNKIVRALFIAIIIIFISIGCKSNQGYIDTGISNGIHDCTMYEYLQRDSYNWDSLVIMIDHSGLTNLFQGGDPKYKDITFFGITNYSILRYMLEKDIEKVTDMHPDFCKEILMGHIFDNRMMKIDIPYREQNEDGTYVEGGVNITTEGDVELRLYNQRSMYNGVVNAGPIIMNMLSVTNQNKDIPIASPDIQTNNGVVHSIHYYHTLGQLISNKKLKELELLNK